MSSLTTTLKHNTYTHQTVPPQTIALKHNTQTHQTEHSQTTLLKQHTHTHTRTHTLTCRSVLCLCFWLDVSHTSVCVVLLVIYHIEHEEIHERRTPRLKIHSIYVSTRTAHLWPGCVYWPGWPAIFADIFIVMKTCIHGNLLVFFCLMWSK